MSGKRRSFEPEFKLQCVLDVLSGRKQFAEQAPKIFANSKANGVSAEAQRIAELERLVGRLTLKLDGAFPAT